MQRAFLILVLIAIPIGLVAIGIRLLQSDRAAPSGSSEAWSDAWDRFEPAADSPLDASSGVTAPAPSQGKNPEARAAVSGSEPPPSAGRRTLEVVAELPAGTPSDEALVAWAFASEPQPAALAGDLDGADAPAHLARATPQADGRILLDLPSGEHAAWVYVRGRYAATRRAVRAGPGTPRLEVLLGLGAWVRGRVTIPEGSDPAEVAGTEVTLRRSPMRQRASFTAGLPPSSVRTSTVREDLTFELGGVLPEPGWRLELVPDTLAAALRPDIELRAGQALDVALALERGATVSGRVLDEAGEGVAAVVTVQEAPLFMGAGGVDVRSGTTAADGSFRLGAVRPGQATLTATAPGFLPSEKDLLIPTGGAQEGVVLELSRGARIAGLVRWPDGTPASGADVRVSFDLSQMAGMGGFNAMRGANGSARAAADGSFEVTGLGAGPFTVRASAERREPRAESGEELAEALEALGYAETGGETWSARKSGVAPGTEDLELELAPPQGLRGRVVEKGGAPVGEFTLRAGLLPEGGGPLAGMSLNPRQQGFKRADGRFVLEGVEPGRWQVSVDAPGFASSEPLQTTVPQPDGEELVIAIERQVVASGVVLDPDGRPVAGATVSPHLGMSALIQVATGQRSNPTALTDSDGAFRLEGLAPGDLSLVASAEGWADSPAQTASASAGDEISDLVLRLRRGGTITGEVYDAEGRPAAGVTVITQTNTGRGQRIQNADAEGRFEARNLTPGSYQVIAMLGDLGDLEIDPEDAAGSSVKMLERMKFQMVTVEDEEEVHVVLGAPPEAPVAVSGSVTVNGAGVESALVQFLARDEEGLSGLKMVTTDGSGGFEVTLDHPGSYLVTVSKTNGVGMANQQIELAEEIPSEEHVRLDLELPVASISGRVRGPDGQPAAGARVTLSTEGGVASGTFLGGHYADTVTDAEGRFSIPWISEGTYTVAAGGSLLGGLLGTSGGEYGRKVRRGVRVSEGENVTGVDFRLGASATLRGSVVDGAGQPVEGVAIFLRTEGGAPLERFSMVATDAGGRFEYAGLEPGVYLVEARGKGLSTRREERVRVALDEPAEVHLVAEGGAMLVVQMVDQHGQPTSARVTVLDESGRQVNGMASLADLVAAFQKGGALALSQERVGPLAPGRYRVSAEAPDGSSAARTVSLSGHTDEKKVILKLKP